LRPVAPGWEQQATLAAVSESGHLVHRIAVPSDDGVLLSMQTILLVTWGRASSSDLCSQRHCHTGAGSLRVDSVAPNLNTIVPWSEASVSLSALCCARCAHASTWLGPPACERKPACH